MVKEKIVIGTWPLSGDLGKAGRDFVAETIQACLDCGFNEFDMAPNYGNGFCEKYFGNFSNNKSLSINTKFGNNVNGVKNFDIDSLKSSFFESLDRLKIEKVNSLFLHNPREEINDYEPIILLFNELKKQNLINRAGISLARNYNYDEILYSFDAIQNDYNMLYQDSVDNDFRKDSIIFYARSPLATGILSGKLNTDTKFESDDYRSKWLKGERLHSIIKRIKILNSLTEMPLDSLARRFVLCNDLIDRVIIGVKTPKHVYDILRDIEEGPLEEVIVGKITDLYKNDFGLEGQRHLSF